MLRSSLKVLGLAAVALMALPLSVKAQENQSEAVKPSAPLVIEGWDGFVDSLRDLPARMLAKLPEPMRNDPQIRAEVGRLALEAIASSSLEAIGGDAMAPIFLPSIGQVLNVGQPNADTVYKAATIDPSQTYRLTGLKGTPTFMVVAQVLRGSNNRPHLDFASLRTDENGHYSVVIGPARPEGYEGDFWQLEPTTRRLMLRIMSSDWSNEVQPTIAIERLGSPVGRKRTSETELTTRLKTLPQAIGSIAPMFVHTVQALADEGYVNRFKVMVPSEGALASQFYYDGVYDIAEDEALIIESEVPKTCRYRSVILTNELYETLDWTNNHSSLNSAQAQPDSDGILRIVVSAQDPGVKNWLDTAGHTRGIIQGRWTGCDSQPIPKLTKVKLAALVKALPKDVAKVTPTEREAIVRERNRAYQQRSLW